MFMASCWLLMIQSTLTSALDVKLRTTHLQAHTKDELERSIT